MACNNLGSGTLLNAFQISPCALAGSTKHLGLERDGSIPVFYLVGVVKPMGFDTVSHFYLWGTLILSSPLFPLAIFSFHLCALLLLKSSPRTCVAGGLASVPPCTHHPDPHHLNLLRPACRHLATSIRAALPAHHGCDRCA